MRVVLAYKNFAAHKNVSHIGLGVAGLNTQKTLIKHGITSEVWPILDSNHLRQLLNLDRTRRAEKPITHVVVSAPWIHTANMRSLCQLFPTISFVMNCHSNVGFLQADSNGMRLLRESISLEMQLHNFYVSANSLKLQEWVNNAFRRPCQYLPNLYYIDPTTIHHRPLWTTGVLRIGIFGATRPQKNVASAVGAAIEIGESLKAVTQIWISSGRTEGGGNTILNAVREMVRGLPTTTLHESGWQDWSQFRCLVASMHLLLQPSYTESFNMVTADGIAEGVPSVVGEAIDWVPCYWRANVDSTSGIAHVGRSLLFNPYAARDGVKALENYITLGLSSWNKFLDSTKFC